MSAPAPPAAAASTAATSDSVPEILKFESANKYIDSTQDFLKSNSIVAKIAFLLFALFFFIIALRVGMYVLSYFLAPSDELKLVDGMRDGTIQLIIPQDPDATGAKTVQRSVNASEGIEFTYSVWIYIKDSTVTDDNNKYRNVFTKGGGASSGSDGAGDENIVCRLWLHP